MNTLVHKQTNLYHTWKRPVGFLPTATAYSRAMFTVPLLKGSEADGTVWTSATFKNPGGRVLGETVARERQGMKEENHKQPKARLNHVFFLSGILYLFFNAQRTLIFFIRHTVFL